MSQPRRPVVLFDAGGTLLEPEYRHLRSVLPPGVRSPEDADFHRGERAARAWFLEATGDGGGVPDGAWRGYFGRVLAGAGVRGSEISAALDRLWEINVRNGLWQRAAAEAPAVLRELLARGFRLAVISNSEGRVAQDLDLAGYSGLFETITDSHHAGVEKPDPRIFALTLDRLGATPDQAVYIGDIYGIDIVGARRAGLHAILIDRFGLQAGCDCPRIEDLRGLPPLLT